MNEPGSRGLWAAIGWLMFPAVPVVVEKFYNGNFPLSFGDRLPPDPHDWGWLTWLIEVGPLIGFGFLAGATMGVADEQGRGRGPRGWLSRRALWVGVGPWWGFLVGVAIFWAYMTASEWLPPAVTQWIQGLFTSANPSLPQRVGFQVFLVLVVATAGYSWLLPGYWAVRRARRVGPGAAWASARRGLVWAAGFVGTLFGGFWAITEGWRGFFFDPRIVPVLLVAGCLGLLCGCSSTITHGELRRRELFQAMLLAWTFGLALFWLWLGRVRTKPPGS